MVTHHSILLIDDSPSECELFHLALIQTGLAVTLFVITIVVNLVATTVVNRSIRKNVGAR